MTANGKSLIHLDPFIVTKIWGGDKLRKFKNLNTSGLIGETWEVSTLKDGESKAHNQPLSTLVGNLSYLVKFIDTSDYLSVQVHPQDDYAKKVENSSGKTECWFILEAGIDAGIYLGFKEHVTKKHFYEAVKRSENLEKYLHFYKVKKGDFFYVPSGSVHAIGKNVTLIEVQQSSGITYRVWDWDRVDTCGKPRQLDVEKALDVLNFDPAQNTEKFFNYKINTFDKSAENFVSHADFKIDIHSINNETSLNFNGKKNVSLICLDGFGLVDGENLKNYHSYLVSEKKISVNTQSSITLMVVYQ